MICLLMAFSPKKVTDLEAKNKGFGKRTERTIFGAKTSCQDNPCLDNS